MMGDVLVTVEGIDEDLTNEMGIENTTFAYRVSKFSGFRFIWCFCRVKIVQQIMILIIINFPHQIISIMSEEFCIFSINNNEHSYNTRRSSEPVRKQKFKKVEYSCTERCAFDCTSALYLLKRLSFYHNFETAQLYFFLLLNKTIAFPLHFNILGYSIKISAHSIWICLISLTKSEYHVVIMKCSHVLSKTKESNEKKKRHFIIFSQLLCTSGKKVP